VVGREKKKKRAAAWRGFAFSEPLTNE